MKKEEFLLERIDEVEESSKDLPVDQYNAIRILCQNNRETVEFHKNWPTLVESPPELQVLDSGLSQNQVGLRMVQQMKWMTQAEYVRVFGVDPPVAPLIEKMLLSYTNHPDYNPDWMTE